MNCRTCRYWDDGDELVLDDVAIGCCDQDDVTVPALEAARGGTYAVMTTHDSVCRHWRPTEAPA